MVNTLYTPEQAARSTLAALRFLTSLPRTVRQDFAAEFVPGRGAVINVKKPITAGAARTYSAANRAARAAIVFDDLAQDVVPITLSDQVYKAIRLPDDWATFSLENLEQEVLVPQAESVVDALSAPLIAAMEAVADPSVGEGDAASVTITGPDDALAVITHARRILNDRKVPFADRFLAVSSSMAEVIVGLPELTDASQSGSDGALREAMIGRLRGFTVIEDPTLSDDFGVAYHRDAFAHVTRPSRVPEGAAKAAVVSQDGFALRWLQHYNPQQLEDQSVVDTFVGADTLDETRAVPLHLDLP